jgi:uncharacterized protein YciI
MRVFIVTYEHPDNEGWQQHLMPHLTWLQDRLQDGSLIASGPFSEADVKSALLIMSAPDQATLESIIATDPFAIEGLIANIPIRLWDPIFGVFNDRSSMPKPK